MQHTLLLLLSFHVTFAALLGMPFAAPLPTLLSPSYHSFWWGDTSDVSNHTNSSTAHEFPEQNDSKSTAATVDISACKCLAKAPSTSFLPCNDTDFNTCKHTDAQCKESCDLYEGCRRNQGGGASQFQCFSGGN